MGILSVKRENIIERPHIAGSINQTADIEAIGDDDIFSQMIVCERRFEAVKAARVTFQQMRFKNVVFTKSDLSAADIEDVIFENCDLSNLLLTGAVIRRTEFLSCKLLGADFSNASFKNVRFCTCAAKYISFRFAVLDRVMFDECGLGLADFVEAHFSSTKFQKADLRQAQMSGVPLDGIDLSSCDIDGLGARAEDLRGAVFSFEQAIVAAKIIGIVIKD